MIETTYDMIYSMNASGQSQREKSELKCALCVSFLRMLMTREDFHHNN